MRFCLTFVTFSVLFTALACSNKSSGGSSNDTGGSGAPVSLGGTIGAVNGGATSSTQSTSGDSGDDGVYELVPGNSTGGGNATFTGTVGGSGLTPTSAVFDIIGDANGNPLAAYVVLASDGNFCNAFVQNQNELANSTHTTMEVFSVDASENILTLDTTQPFTMTTNQDATGNIAGQDFLVEDGNCTIAQPSSQIQATAGTLTITNLSVTSVTGNFNTTIGTSQVSGSFQAAPCPGLAAIELSQTIILGCQ